MKTFNNFIKEEYYPYFNNEIKSPDYCSYTKKLDVDEFFDLYIKNCKNFNWRKPSLYRGMHADNASIYHINSSKHEVRLTAFNTCLYILYGIIDKSEIWKKFGYPNKYRSINFLVNEHRAGFYGEEYIVIPYDNAKLALSLNFIGDCLPNLTKVFNPKNYIKNHKRSEPSPFHFTEDIINYYEKNINKFKFNDVIGCLNELHDFLKDKKIDQINNNTIKSIKIDMDKRNMNLVEALDFYFNPIDNEFKLIRTEDLDNIDKTYSVGWTDSEVLLVRLDIYTQIKNKFNKLKL